MLINTKREKFRNDIRKKSMQEVIIKKRLHNMKWIEDLK